MLNKIHLIAGISDQNMTLYHRTQFAAGDPSALLIQMGEQDRIMHQVFIVRDIEADRARTCFATSTDKDVFCPADLVGANELSVDREIATGQAIAQWLKDNDANEIWLERSTPIVYQKVLSDYGINTYCDPTWQADARRSKSEQELQYLKAAQGVTEQAMLQACRTIANAKADPDGQLKVDGQMLTSERLAAMIDSWLLPLGYVDSNSIIAGGLQGADCHNRGTGPLRTGQPIIIDIFPRDKQSHYYGDCSRTVVHGKIPTIVSEMHHCVVKAKHAATLVVAGGKTGSDVHHACMKVIHSNGFKSGPFQPGSALDEIAMTHGTGHGVGLSLHEAPLLVDNGPKLLIGDVITIEPGLYCRTVGGVRVEDMVAVTEDGCETFNALPEGLDWKTY